MAIEKARYCTGVCYPENMVDGWENRIGDILQVPYAYCIHDADHNIDGEDRKTHVHLIVVFENTTTYKHALNCFKLLGDKCVNKCEAVVNIKHVYNYLIHDTETCRKQGKHLYDESCRIEGNNFDIGSYEQISKTDQNAMLRDMLDFVVANELTDITTFFMTYPNINDTRYFDVFKSYGSLIERMCKGNHHRHTRG